MTARKTKAQPTRVRKKPPQGPASSGWTLAIPIGLIVLAGILVYSNTLHGEFQFDDRNNILDNPAVREGEILRQPAAWLHLAGRPLSYATFALNLRWYGPEVESFHAVNLAIHILAGILVFFLARRIVRLTGARVVFAGDGSGSPSLPRDPAPWVAAAVALLFIVHPVQTQAVTYIVQRMASLAALFYLLSVLLYAEGRLLHVRGVALGKAFCLYAGALLAGLLAVLAKENAATFPAAWLLVEIYFIRKPDGRPYWKYIGVAAGILVSLVAVGIGSGYLPTDLRHAETFSRFDYFVTQWRVVAQYWRLAVLPFGQNVDYDFPISHSPWGIAEMGSLALLLVILAAGIWLYRKDRAVSFGIFWFFLALAVESGPIPIADVICEHRLYLPLFGFCLLAAAGLWRLLSRWDWPAYATVITVLAAALGVTAWQRNEVWRTEVSLWSDTVRKSPNKARPLYNLGVAKKNAGEVLAARDLYDQVLRIQPSDYPALVDRGLLKRAAGDLSGARADFDRAILAKPGQAAAYLDRSQVRSALGDASGALADLDLAIRLQPDLFQAYVNRAALRDSRGDEAGALADLDSAIRLSPEDPTAYNNRGTIRARKGDIQGAIGDFTAAIQRKPDYAKAIVNRGMARLQLRDTQGARSDLEAAQAILKGR